MQTLAKWTVEDYHQMIAAGILSDRRVELLAGDIHEMTPEGPLHTFYGGSLADFFRDRLGRRALVREARPITLATSEPEPDIALVQGTWERYRDRHPNPAEIFLLIEVSDSSLVKDLETKSEVYAAAKIPEYWVLNLPTRKLIVFRDPQDHHYRTRQDLQTGAIAPLAFPDIELTLSEWLKPGN